MLPFMYELSVTIALSSLKCSHSKAISMSSCLSLACSSWSWNTWRRLACAVIALFLISSVSSFVISHRHISCGTAGWCWMKFSLFSFLPSDATMKPKPYLYNFSNTLVVAELLLETTSTVFFCNSMFAMILRMVCVFPVPGGPCITLIWFSNAAVTALSWLALHPNGKIHPS